MPAGHELFMNLPELITPRLLLRSMSVDDAPDLFAYASDPLVSRFLSWDAHTTIDDSRRFLQDAVDAYAAGDARSWAVVHRADGRMIGTAGFLFWDLRANRSEIGYAMSAMYWGQGLMTEAVSEIVRFGFETMTLNRIEARCDALNRASVRVLEKAGMRHEGTLRQQFVIDGEYRDMQLYAILRQDWPGIDTGARS